MIFYTNYEDITHIMAMSHNLYKIDDSITNKY